jgi:uncharacterized protein
MTPPPAPTPPCPACDPAGPEPSASVRPPAANRRATPWLALPFVVAIRMYQVTLGWLFTGQCRYYPTCSHYGVEAYQEHGPWRGTVLTLGRVLRCHPFSRGGYDPVPPATASEPVQARTDDGGSEAGPRPGAPPQGNAANRA